METFYEGMAEVFEIDASLVTPELDLQEHNWDSLAVVSTIALVDDCFNVMLSGQALNNCNTIADIEALIRAAKKAA
ncbi:acyl carrier protein [Paraburkholderia fungorum]|uniref:acyl carrier protein n=1 Tax=Paraburkholderia fungorum TaxID=134537 RepID=UPI0038BA2BC9